MVTVKMRLLAEASKSAEFRCIKLDTSKVEETEKFSKFIAAPRDQP